MLFRYFDVTAVAAADVAAACRQRYYMPLMLCFSFAATQMPPYAFMMPFAAMPSLYILIIIYATGAPPLFFAAQIIFLAARLPAYATTAFA